MPRHKSLVAMAFTCGLVLTVVGVASAAGPSNTPATSYSSDVALAGSVAPFVSASSVEGPVNGSRQLTIQLWLRPELMAASSFAAAVSSPGSPLFHHYLSPAAYTERFGASVSSAVRVESWLRSSGFSHIHLDSQRSYVRATGVVSRIDESFRTQVDYFRSSGESTAGVYRLRSNDGPLSLPQSISGLVLGVTGIDNASPVTPIVGINSRPSESAGLTSCSSNYGERLATGLPQAFGRTSFPTIICGYTGRQLRQAYDASYASQGAGITVALVEEGLTKDMFLTLQDYANHNEVPAPSAKRYSELSLGSDSCGDPFDGEEQLDVEASYDMAPGADQLVVGGDSCDNGDEGNQSLFDADEAVLDGAGGHPLATIASNSWESGAESQPSSYTQIEHSYLLRAAGEGVGMYFSAGDGSGVLSPASDPDAIAVGGTTLGIDDQGNRLFETGWSDGESVVKNGKWSLVEEEGASGGGPSVLYREPAYQRGVVPASYGDHRVDPDLSADADPFTGMALGQLNFKTSKPSYYQVPIGGTSESSPLVAGIVASAQQGQSTAFGFIDPAIYSLSGTSAFFDAMPLTNKSPSRYRAVECDRVIFADLCGDPAVPTLMTFDDQNPKMLGYTGQVTTKGYDDMTGLGSPDTPHFIAALRKLDHSG